MEQLLYKITKKPRGDLSDAPHLYAFVWLYLWIQQRRSQQAVPLSYGRIAEELGRTRTEIRDAAAWLETHGYIKPL